MRLLYAILMGLWRDSFGKNGWDLPIYKNRFVQHVVSFLMTFSLCFFDKGISWFWCLWVALWIQILFSVGHGYAYDVAMGGEPDEKMLKRYKKAVGYKLLCKIFPKDKWYKFGFDFCLLAIRYTWPLLPICVFFNPVLFVLGLVIASLYTIYRYCPYMQKHRLLDVEIWVGFTVGLFVAYL